MEYIQVTRENIEKEHICCAISNNKDIQVLSKKTWMDQCFDDGLTFIKSAERGKCFIEISRPNMHGFLLLRPDICILIVFGCQVL